MSKKLPALKSDKQAEELLDKDLSEYISAENLQPFPFEYRPKQKSVNLRISVELLGAVRAAAVSHTSATFAKPWNSRSSAARTRRRNVRRRGLADSRCDE